MKAIYRKSDNGFQARLESYINEDTYNNSEYVVIEAGSAPEKQQAVLTEQEVEIEGEMVLQSIWEVKPIADASEVNEKILSDLRNKRNEILLQSDWTQLSDSPLDSQLKTDWANYRQALRDLPENIDLSEIGALEDITFPVKPGEE